MRSQHDNRFPWNRFLLMILVSGVLLGCEETQEHRGLTVSPNSPELSQAGERVVLTASLPEVGNSATNIPSGLLYPLEWSVSDPAMGRIISSTANIAIYECDVGSGKNVVVVRDQGDREGLANIN